MNEIVYKYNDNGVSKTIDFTTEEDLTIVKFEYPYVKAVDAFKVSPLNRKKMAYEAINSRITWNHVKELTEGSFDIPTTDVFYQFVVLDGVNESDYKKNAMLPIFNEETLETELVDVPNAVFKTSAEMTTFISDLELPEMYLGFGLALGSLFNDQ